jgi:hypothetical protein
VRVQEGIDHALGREDPDAGRVGHRAIGRDAVQRLADDAARERRRGEVGLAGRTTIVGSLSERPSIIPLRVRSATRYSPITFCVP